MSKKAIFDTKAIQDTKVKNLESDTSWTGDFDSYLEIVQDNPKAVHNAWQRMSCMIKSHGTEEIKIDGEPVTKYNFFGMGTNPVVGLEPFLEMFAATINAGAMGYGPERRMILLHGPVGSSKSTLCAKIKKGLEDYSRTNDGELYSYTWVHLDGLADAEVEEEPCPMNDDPLYLIPAEARQEFLDDMELDFIYDGELSPLCQYYYDHYMDLYNGDWYKMIKEHIRIRRVVLSETRRIGIGTFQPKDEKNQDSTELTGDVNLRRLARIGRDSDPRAFNFDGEFNIANRGCVEFIEVLKLQKEFLYDLLGATQEHRIKPKKFAQIRIDSVILGHTNNPEFEKMKMDEYMEALKDRTVKINIPYLLKWGDESRVYEYRLRGAIESPDLCVAPHTIAVSSFFAIATRLKDPKKPIKLSDKIKLYDGKAVKGWNVQGLKELKEEYEGLEGLDGLSARFLLDSISSELVVPGRTCVNPFMVMKSIERGIKDNPRLTDENIKVRYLEKLEQTKQEYEEIIKDEVQKALIGDDDAVRRLFENYIDNIVAHVEGTKVKNPFTQEEEEPDRELMESVEAKMSITPNSADGVRNTMVKKIGALAIAGTTFKYDTDPELLRGLQNKLFEDTKDTIKISHLSNVGGVVDPDIQDKIDALKTRMKDKFSYCDQCASDVLQYVSSIFARGDIVRTET